MVSRVKCIQCGALNVRQEGALLWCGRCFHRADVPLAECDCPMCHAPPDVPELLDVEQLGVDVTEIPDPPEAPDVKPTKTGRAAPKKKKKKSTE